jgi:hypothetical protein
MAEKGLDYLVIRDSLGEPQGVSYELVPVYLLEIARDQKDRIESLEAENERLSDQLEDVLKRLDALEKK